MKAVIALASLQTINGSLRLIKPKHSQHSTSVQKHLAQAKEAEYIKHECILDTCTLTYKEDDELIKQDITKSSC